MMIDVTKLKSPVYISGPITGMPEGNKQAFKDAEEYLTELGYLCINPRHLEIPFCLKWEGRNPCKDINKKGGERLWDLMMKRSLAEMMECNSVALLEGWEQSKGAVIEYQLCGILNLPVTQLKQTTV